MLLIEKKVTFGKVLSAGECTLTDKAFALSFPPFFKYALSFYNTCPDGIAHIIDFY